MKILSSVTHHQVVPNLYEFLSFYSSKHLLIQVWNKWRWLNHARIFIIRWTIPLILVKLLYCIAMWLLSAHWFIVSMKTTSELLLPDCAAAVGRQRCCSPRLSAADRSDARTAPNPYSPADSPEPTPDGRVMGYSWSEEKNSQLTHSYRFTKTWDPDLMRTKANDGGIRQNSDEDLWLEHVISSWDFKGFCQTNQAPRQSVEYFIKDHLSCAVILKTDSMRLCTLQRDHSI